MGTRAVRPLPAALPLSAVPPSVTMVRLPDSDPAAVTGSSVNRGHIVARAEPEEPGDAQVDLEVSVR
ncbi:hypothetical protein [Streptomyces syringium]|uniref:PASTA domain-containing protein n=1 Tax=Streptomyces syringium TaxID=76729 RepID=A0ABS4Y8K0_9ACTN|nr:hypothetical protein [Streptomyces syringium]MBP2405091.1 hypothetical protein [Streptomyces syringium]GGR18246.1 hypothetical protein GCM10010219_24380 [Streptomyces netropsis]